MERQTIKCNCCGKPLSVIEANMFTHEGSDTWVEYPFTLCTNDAVYMDLYPDWTGSDLDPEEQVETIRCPSCHKYPFKEREIQTYPIVRAVMFDEKSHGFGAIDIPQGWIMKKIKENPGPGAHYYRRILEEWEEEIRKENPFEQWE